jgi:uncharacterized membrane protein YeaQ/YmgE (transglycosylase-associated protein family)
VDVEPDPDFFATLEVYINLFFVYVGFGTVVGLVGKAIMPGRDPGGAIATLGMGIGGTVIGCGLLSLILEGKRVSPISPLGFFVGTAGVFIILFFYRLLGGYWFVEGDQGSRSRVRPHRRRRRRSYAYDYDD